MNLSHKSLFVLMTALGMTTSAYATYQCCSLDTVALCGDECCKQECDSSGKCPKCTSAQESRICCEQNNGHWKNNICCSTTESNKTVEGTDNTTCGCAPRDYSETCCEENGGTPSHRMNVSALDFLCCRSDGKTMQGEDIEGCCSENAKKCSVSQTVPGILVCHSNVFSQEEFCKENYICEEQESGPKCICPKTQSDCTGARNKLDEENCQCVCPDDKPLYNPDKDKCETQSCETVADCPASGTQCFDCTEGQCVFKLKYSYCKDSKTEMHCDGFQLSSTSLLFHEWDCEKDEICINGQCFPCSSGVVAEHNGELECCKGDTPNKLTDIMSNSWCCPSNATDVTSNGTCCTNTQTLIANACCDNIKIAEHGAEKECCSGTTPNRVFASGSTTTSYCCANATDHVDNNGNCCTNSAWTIYAESTKACYCANPEHANDNKCKSDCGSGYKKCWDGNCVAKSSCCPDENPSLYAGYSWNCNECTSPNTGSTSTWQLKSDYQKCSDGACAYKTYVGGVFYGGCCSDSDCTSQNDDYYCYFCKDYSCQYKTSSSDKSCCESKGKKWCAETENYSGQCVEQTECCQSEKPTCMYYRRGPTSTPSESSTPYTCNNGKWELDVERYKTCPSNTCMSTSYCCPDSGPTLWLNGKVDGEKCKKCTDPATNTWSLDDNAYRMSRDGICVRKYDGCTTDQDCYDIDENCSSDSDPNCGYCLHCNTETYRCESTVLRYVTDWTDFERACCSSKGWWLDRGTCWRPCGDGDWCYPYW